MTLVIKEIARTGYINRLLDQRRRNGEDASHSPAE
jgi:hypothetical protein